MASDTEPNERVQTTRERLVERVAERLAQCGLAGVGLRDLAEAAGVSHRTLLYHFGSREALIIAALGAMRERQFQMVQSAVAIDESRPASMDVARGVWKNISADESKDWFLLFFEVFASALRDTRAHAEFLDEVVGRWIRLADVLFAGDHPALVENDSATLLLAALRGLHLDLLATGDRARVDRALETLIGMFEETSARAATGTEAQTEAHD